MDYAPAGPTPPLVPDVSFLPDAGFDPNDKPSVEDLLKDIPEPPPLPKWNDPELRFMPKTSDEGQPPVTPDEAWRKIHNLVEKYDKGMCESYREQIDTLLVFAGLFSAVVTAFAIESYQWLQDDPADSSADLLRQAVVLLSTLANQTSPSPLALRSPELPDSVVVRINVYWFLSLVLSLSAALTGIVCKQWLREYERDIGQSAQQALSVRQMKFEGLETWRVGAIVTSVPLLLQLALALFLIGISELLWHLHRTVAIAVTTASGLTGLFYLMTASAPMLQYLYLSISSRLQGTRYHPRVWSDPLPGRAFTLAQCPYKSPQAWLALRICQPVFDWIIFHDYLQRSGQRPDSWVYFDAYWTVRRDEERGPAETTTSRALMWTAHTLGETYLKAWRVICSRQQLAQAHSPTPYRTAWGETAMRDRLPSLLEGVDDANEQARLHKQVVLFSSSCDPDLDLNTSVELFLQLATNTAFDPAFSGSLSTLEGSFSQPTLNGLKPILNDGLAIQLLRVLQDKLGPYRPDSFLLFVDALAILRWAPSCTLFLPAVCAITLRFLQSPTVAVQASPLQLDRGQQADLVLGFVSNIGIPSRIGIRQRGFGHIVALAEFMLDNYPASINNEHSRKTLDNFGLRRLYEERLLRVQHRPDDDDVDSDATERAEAPVTPDVLIPPPSLSEVVSTAANSALVDDTRIPLHAETEITRHDAAAGQGYGDESAAPHLDASNHQGLPIIGVSAASRVSRPVPEPSAIGLRDIPARAGDTDDAARTDPRLGLEQPNSREGGSGVTSTSVPPHIAIPIEPPDMSASLGGPDLEIPPTSPFQDS